MFGKRTQEEAEEIVAARGYELVSEYTGANDLIDIYCYDCSATSTLYWGNFNILGYGCHHCAKENRRKNLRIPFEQIKKEFESKGFVMLSTSDDYINNKSPLRCICPCGRETTNYYRNVMRGGTCRKCGSQARAASQRTPFDQIITDFKEHGFTMLSEATEFVNNKSLLRCLCKCGQETRTSWGTVRKAQGCKKCGMQRKGENQKHTKAQVYQFANNQGLDIIDYDYKTSIIPMKFECKTCKFQFEMCLASVKNNSGCPRCKCSSGEYKLLQFVQKILAMQWKREYRIKHDFKK